MLTGAFWLLGGVVAAGLALAASYMAGRPIRRAARWLSIAHGVAGAAGVGLVAAVVWRAASDPGGFGQIAAVMLGVALLGGVAVMALQLRRRRAPGLLIALHATVGVGGYVILAAYVWR